MLFFSTAKKFKKYLLKSIEKMDIIRLRPKPLCPKHILKSSPMLAGYRVGLIKLTTWYEGQPKRGHQAVNDYAFKVKQLLHIRVINNFIKQRDMRVS